MLIAVLGQLVFISINTFTYIFIAVKLIQWLEVCLSFGSSRFSIFIENAVHGTCSESERFWKEAGNGGPRFPCILDMVNREIYLKHLVVLIQISI